jgi:HTH-type transcriptional regulator, sugar sensing transcriptional regulator
MEHIPAGLVKSLTALGLTSHEARVYAALVLFDRAEARDLVEYLGISKPSVYEVLEHLEEIGLTVRLNAKPVRYGAVSPEIALKILMDAHEDAAAVALQDLQALEKAKVETAASDTLWAVYGDRNLAYKARDMMKNAKRQVDCVIADRYLPFLDPLQGKDIEVRLRVFSDNTDLKKQLDAQFRGQDILVIPPRDITGSCEFTGIVSPEMRPHIRLDYILQMIVDDAEMLLIQPIACTRVSGLNTTNPAIIQFMRVTSSLFQDWMNRMAKRSDTRSPGEGSGKTP